jgi:protein O-GlcNAc transferase
MQNERSAGRANGAIDALIEKGNRLEDSGAPHAALDVYQEAVALAPDSARALLNMGNALLALNRRADAEIQYRAAIAREPGNAAAHLNLGNALLALNNFGEALEMYREASRLRPDWADAWAGIGCALEESGKLGDAVDAYEQAIRCDPGHTGAACNASDVLSKLGRVVAAKQVLEEGLKRNPRHPSLMNALGHLHCQLAEHALAVRVYRDVLEANQGDIGAFSNLLNTLTYVPGITTDALLEEHRRFGDLLERRTIRLAPSTSAVPGKRLKVGYVSADFRNHSMAYFISPLLTCHDRASFELYCYHNHRDTDDVTDRLKGAVEHWRQIDALTDDTVARQIVDDGIDILVDLSGHTAGNRLGVFARKPAPLQITALGYPFTTGLRAIDYRICDAHTDPAGDAEHWQVETLLRLPATQFCFQPVIEFPPPAPLPRLSRSYWIFGSFNRLMKLNEPLLRSWAEIMLAVPGSRLRLATIEHESARRWIRAALEGSGISADRIEFAGRVPLDAYFASYGEVDIALDTVPASGGSTTCDALMMGVPVASIAGQHPFGRNGVSLLSAVGLDDWIAASPADLPAVVSRQIADPARLARLRAELPARVRASRLMDGACVTRDVEAAYRAAWQRWCKAPNT